VKQNVIRILLNLYKKFKLQMYMSLCNDCDWSMVFIITLSILSAIHDYQPQ